MMINKVTDKNNVFKYLDLVIDEILDHCRCIYDMLLELDAVDYKGSPRECYDAVYDIFMVPKKDKQRMLYHTNFCIMLTRDMVEQVTGMVPDTTQDACQLTHENAVALGGKAFELWMYMNCLQKDKDESGAPVLDRDKFDLGVKLDDLETAYVEFIDSLSTITDGMDYAVMRQVSYILFGKLKAAE